MLKTEKQLITELKVADKEAFDTLFFKYYGKVYNLSISYLHRKEDAEEIVQATFIAVWENRSEIDEDRSFSAYLQGIARNLIFNTIKRRVYRQRFVDYYLNHTNILDYSTEMYIHYNELKLQLDRLIDELPLRRREIFILSRKEGLSYKQIAEKLSITESTVNTQLSTALDYLRKNLEDL